MIIKALKENSLILLLILPVMVFVNYSYGQTLIPLDVSLEKAVHLLFPADVNYCDTGNEDVVYRVTDNIVKLNAKKIAFAETNLTVITKDNVLYTFLLIYKEAPRKLNVILSLKEGKQIGNNLPDNLVASTSTEHTEEVMDVEPEMESQNVNSPSETTVLSTLFSKEDFDSVCLKMVNNGKSLLINDISHNVGLELFNIFEYKGYHFFSLYAYNHSKKPFEVDIVNFQQAEKSWSLGKVYREDLIAPVYTFNDKKVIAPEAKFHFIYTFEKITLEDGKIFLIEMGADDGRRILSLKIPYKFINEARVFEEVK